tara:strand:+ start:448 stop:762 length:315 start_codon:yes stop_codon:yes gene_type:complete
MNIFVDIDETICQTPDDRDYSKARPLQERIEKINSLYDEGNKITFWTARGSGTGLDWRKTTEKQLKEWGVKYHELKMWKPVYDLFICDKAINSNLYFNKGVNNG